MKRAPYPCLILIIFIILHVLTKTKSMKTLKALIIFFCFLSIFGSKAFSADTLLFATGYDTIVINVGDLKPVFGDLLDSGVMYVCPDEGTGNYFIHYRIDVGKDNKAEYHMKFPDTNTRNLYEFTYSMSGEYYFSKTIDPDVWAARITVNWISCPATAEKPIGTDTIYNTDSAYVYQLPGYGKYDSVMWFTDPADAGTISINDTTLYFNPDDNFTGKVEFKAIGLYGSEISIDDELSGVKTITVLEQPNTNIATKSIINKVNIYPNPASHAINFSFHNEIPNNIKIIDMAGKILVNENKVNKNPYTLTPPGYATGTYIAVFKFNNKKITKKLIIE